MAIILNHTIVPARDKVEAARFFADMLGLHFDGVDGHFAPVKVNDSLTLDFADAPSFEPHHYAFLVSDEEFDAIYDRVKAAGVAHASGPRSGFDNQISHEEGGVRRVYFPDSNRHFYEIMTRA
jgi:catechol 2,3-dioxygenase-like lactoylglutathione lyase family enzyme